MKKGCERWEGGMQAGSGWQSSTSNQQSKRMCTRDQEKNQTLNVGSKQHSQEHIHGFKIRGEWCEITDGAEFMHADKSI